MQIQLSVWANGQIRTLVVDKWPLAPIVVSCIPGLLSHRRAAYVTLQGRVQASRQEKIMLKT